MAVLLELTHGVACALQCRVNMTSNNPKQMKEEASKFFASLKEDGLCVNCSTKLDKGVAHMTIYFVCMNEDCTRYGLMSIAYRKYE